MTWQLISATPSPYARKVRIALQEKGLPFDLKTEVPWDSTTKTPDFNPLEKLPVLILDDGRTAIYESHYIMEWLEAKHPEPSLLPPEAHLDERLFAKKVEVVADGICDAAVLLIFESKRESPSKEWTARQTRKVEGGLKTLNDWVAGAQSKYLIGDSLTLADIAIGSALGFLAVRMPDQGWQDRFPALASYAKQLESLPSFADTRPVPQNIKDKIV